MATEQLDLLARAGDPATSQAAAASLTPDVLSRRQQQALVALVHLSRGVNGADRHQVAQRLRETSWPHAEVSSVSKRLGELVEAGLAVVVTTHISVTGHGCRVYGPTLEGWRAGR